MWNEISCVWGVIVLIFYECSSLLGSDNNFSFSVLVQFCIGFNVTYGVSLTVMTVFSHLQCGYFFVNTFIRHLCCAFDG